MGGWINMLDGRDRQMGLVDGLRSDIQLEKER